MPWSTAVFRYSVQIKNLCLASCILQVTCLQENVKTIHLSSNIQRTLVIITRYVCGRGFQQGCEQPAKDSKLLQEIRGLWLGIVAVGQTMKHFSKLQKDLHFKSLDTQLKKERFQFTGQISFANLVIYFSYHLSCFWVFNFYLGYDFISLMYVKYVYSIYVLLCLALFCWIHGSYQSTKCQGLTIQHNTNILIN